MRWIITSVLLGLCAPAANAAEPAKLTPAQRRERLMSVRVMVETFAARTGDETTLKPLALAAEPSLLYADNERELSDASLWVWEADGRLAALSAVELRPKAGTNGVWTFECASLSAVSVRMTVAMNDWVVAKNAVHSEAIPDAPAAAMTRSQRFLQLRKLADRFTATSHSADQGRIELRRLAAPVYRQGDSTSGDAALFAFANGTNPEVLLFVQTAGAGMPWTYCLASLSGDAASAQLDGREIWRVERYTGPGTRDTYINGKLSIEPPR